VNTKEAIEYLMPINESAHSAQYKEALGFAIAALDVVLEREEREKKTKTRADVIRSMDNKALATWLAAPVMLDGAPKYWAVPLGEMLETKALAAELNLHWLREKIKSNENCG